MGIVRLGGLATAALAMACAGDLGAGPEHGRAGGEPSAHGDCRGPARGGHGEGRFEDAEAWAARFEDPGRDEWQRPEVVLEALALEPTSRVAEIGSATGYFAVRIARRVPEGRVWAVDVEPDMVRYLNRRARREGLPTLFSILGTAPDPLLPEPVDAVLVVDTYHHIEDRPAYFRRLAESLRPGGRLVVVDFRMGELPEGPPESMRIAPEEVGRELEEAGYRRVGEDLTSLPRQYLLVYMSGGSSPP